MRTLLLPADFIPTRACKPICEKYLTLPIDLILDVVAFFYFVVFAFISTERIKSAIVIAEFTTSRA